MRLYKVVILVNVALGLGLLSGFLWWERENTRLNRELAVARQRAAPRQAGDRSWTVKGIVRGVSAEANLIFLTHEEIPGLMPSMTMGFRAGSPDLLRGVVPGDPVQFTLKETGSGVVLVAVRKEGNP